MENHRIHYLFICLALLIGSILINLLLLRKNKESLARHLGGIGVLFPAVFSCLPQLLGIFWIISLLPPFSNPGFYLTEIGYFSYGRDFAYYPHACMYISAVASFPVWIYTALAAAVPGRLKLRTGSALRELKSAGMKLTVPKLLALLSILMAAAGLYLHGKGWDSLYIARAGRFESEIVNAATRYTSVIQVLLFFGAMVSCALFLVPGAIVIKAACWIVSVVPLIVAQSRMFGVACVALVGVGLYNIRSKTARIILATPMVLIAYIAYIVPFNLRSNDSVGLYFFATSILYVLQNWSELLSLHSVAPIIANLGMALPNVSEMFECKLLGSVGEEEVRYYLLMFSPLPGAVDGFADLFQRYGKFHNAYTPYNFIAELSAAGWVIPILVMFLVFSLYWIIFKIPVREGLAREISEVICCGSVFIFIIFSSQYHPRVCFKIIYITIGLKFMISILAMIRGQSLTRKVIAV